MSMKNKPKTLGNNLNASKDKMYFNSEKRLYRDSTYA